MLIGSISEVYQSGNMEKQYDHLYRHCIDALLMIMSYFFGGQLIL